MGSSNSRLGSRPSRPRVNRAITRSLLSSFVCGGSSNSSSHATHEMESHPTQCLVKYAGQRDLDTSQLDNSTEGSSLVSSRGARITYRPIIEIGSSSETTVASIQDTHFEEGLRNGMSNQGKGLSKSKELISPHQVIADCSHDESGRDNSTTASTYKEQQSSDLVNSSANLDTVNDFDNPADKNVSQICPEVVHPSSLSPEGIRISSSDEVLVENVVGEVMAVHSSDADSSPASEIPFRSLENDSLRDAVPSGLGFLMSNRDQGQEDGSALHVDVMSISSNFLSNGTDTSSRESRRNGRRLFWDAFSRRSSRRFIDSPTILLSTAEAEDSGFHDRWLLDLSGDSFDDGVGTDPSYQGNRIPNLSERRRNSRSEVWERLRVGLDDNGQRNTSCPTGIHPRGMCSCGSFLMAEESSTRASISRIVMLAEALFEVLDEIHRQPVSLSLSMVSIPAPASVVDSFPLKSHTKFDTENSKDDVDQCYICLAEYEEGDKIRVLPCHHEYHMLCVDKWLKDIQGVCPLCRGDVRESSTDCSVSNSEVPST